MRKLLERWHRYCVREKGHLLVGGGYLGSRLWDGHNSTLMAAVYGGAALLATHKIYRSAAEPELKHRPSRRRDYQPKHLARG